MDNALLGEDADDEDDLRGPNLLPDLFTQPIFYFSDFGTIDPMAPSATGGGAAPPIDATLENFQQINGSHGFTDAAILNLSDSTENYMDSSSL
jgi:hypothetical protein